jgi:uncharacterized protein
MTSRRAGIVLLTETGVNLADKISPRLLSLRLSEKREDDADEIDLTLENTDGFLAVPRTGVRLSLALGWEAGADVPLGLVDKGRFTINEIELSGEPEILSIRGRSADLTGALRKRETRTWRDTTLGAILSEIASKHGRTPRIGEALAAQAITVIEQEGKSDMAFVRDLGKRYDAVATWKDNFLLFLPIGASATASGTALTRVLITRRDGWTWKFREAQRESYKGAEAQWYDDASGRRRTVKVDGPATPTPESDSEGEDGEQRQAPTEPKKLKRVYATEAEARQAAEAAASRAARAPYEFSYDIAIADPAIQPDTPASLIGWNPLIDGIDWLVKTVETSFDGSGGMRQRIELESA